MYATENFNGDCTDDLLRPVKQWQARQESKDLSKVTIRGLLSKVQSGSWMGGVPPYGYDLKYENSEGRFLFILRHLPDRTKKVLDEKGQATAIPTNTTEAEYRFGGGVMSKRRNVKTWLVLVHPE